MMKYISKSENETAAIGETLAKLAKPGTVYALEGPLGAGKSVLIRGIAQELGVEEAMPSPTFTLVNEYKTSELSVLRKELPLYHFDFYRINDPFELYEIGFEEYIYSSGVSFVEWPSKAGDLLPKDKIEIIIKINQNDEREIFVNE